MVGLDAKETLKINDCLNDRGRDGTLFILVDTFSKIIVFKKSGMDDILKTEEEYREALQRFLEILESDDGSYDACELFELMRKLEVYEQENCV